jgi:hypothetical protein
LADLLRGQYVRFAVASGYATKVGEMVRSYSNNISGFEIEWPYLFSVGESIYAGDLMVGDIKIESVSVESDRFHWQYMHVGEFVGLKTNRKLAKNSCIYQIHAT